MLRIVSGSFHGRSVKTSVYSVCIGPKATWLGALYCNTLWGRKDLATAGNLVYSIKPVFVIGRKTGFGQIDALVQDLNPRLSLWVAVTGSSCIMHNPSFSKLMPISVRLRTGEAGGSLPESVSTNTHVMTP